MHGAGVALGRAGLHRAGPARRLAQLGRQVSRAGKAGIQCWAWAATLVPDPLGQLLDRSLLPSSCASSSRWLQAGGRPAAAGPLRRSLHLRPAAFQEAASPASLG